MINFYCFLTFQGICKKGVLRFFFVEDLASEENNVFIFFWFDDWGEGIINESAYDICWDSSRLVKFYP